MRVYRQAERARRAALLHLDEGIAVPSLAERFDTTTASIYAAIRKLRQERGLAASGARVCR